MKNIILFTRQPWSKVRILREKVQDYISEDVLHFGFTATGTQEELIKEVNNLEARIRIKLEKQAVVLIDSFNITEKRLLGVLNSQLTQPFIFINVDKEQGSNPDKIIDLVKKLRFKLPEAPPETPLGLEKFWECF